MRPAGKPLGLYIHIPFCKSKCVYCDFYSLAGNEGRMDDYMDALDDECPQYGWRRNKGYPTREHREAIRQHGITPYHRRSYNLTGQELPLPFDD